MADYDGDGQINYEESALRIFFSRREVGAQAMLGASVAFAFRSDSRRHWVDDTLSRVRHNLTDGNYVFRKHRSRYCQLSENRCF